MLTEIKKPTPGALCEAAELVRAGGIVGMPTETVYGLAGNALSPDSVRAIFTAKGRPQDNPLIVHIAEPGVLDDIAVDIPDIAYTLAAKFWPGPLTLVLPKSAIVPRETTGGLATVAVRMPRHDTALALIRESGLPIAAPSANTSGRPSPTTARHVMADMAGKIPLILDGGECACGVESTVVSFRGDTARILRPGGVTLDMLSGFCRAEYDPAVLNKLTESEPALSPGTKYRHYAPRARVVLVEGGAEGFAGFFGENAGEKDAAVVFTEGTVSGRELVYGESAEEQSQRLFSVLREADEMGAETLYVQVSPDTSGSIAVRNRLLRAADFNIIKL